MDYNDTTTERTSVNKYAIGEMSLRIEKLDNLVEELMDIREEARHTARSLTAEEQYQLLETAKSMRFEISGLSAVFYKYIVDKKPFWKRLFRK